MAATSLLKKTAFPTGGHDPDRPKKRKRREPRYKNKGELRESPTLVMILIATGTSAERTTLSPSSSIRMETAS